MIGCVCNICFFNLLSRRTKQHLLGGVQGDHCLSGRYLLLPPFYLLGSLVTNTAEYYLKLTINLGIP